MTIGTLPVAGGILGLTHLPGRDGAFDADIAAWADFSPSLVLSLTEPSESDPARIAAALAARAIAHRHVPVRDYDVPPPGMDWPALRDCLRTALAGGGRALIHCHGGRGRSGMIALRLMIEAGEPPDSALTRLRAARPGAVETPQQEAWARRGAP